MIDVSNPDFARKIIPMTIRYLIRPSECDVRFWREIILVSVGYGSENCLVTLRFSKNLNALPFRCSMNASFRTRLGVGFRYFEGHFRTRWCLRHVFCGVMHHCVVRRSGSVPTEISEPTREARSSRHVFIETMQSKDFSENLVTCVNFQITASRMSIVFSSKIVLPFVVDKISDR